MPHDGEVIAETSVSNFAASRSLQAWRSIELSAFGRTGGVCCATIRSMVSISSAARSPLGPSSAAALAYGCASTWRP